MLLLAAPDRMDNQLTIAQMQGKFKLSCFKSDVGHTMHEDSPDEMAEEMKTFLKRFKVPLNLKQLNEAKQLGYGKFKNGF